jgi:hypothetical protein
VLVSKDVCRICGDGVDEDDDNEANRNWYNVKNAHSGFMENVWDSQKRTNRLFTMSVMLADN